MRDVLARLPTIALALLIAMLVVETARPPQPLAVEPSATGRTWYVAPRGRPDNPGTIDAPLDLATALSKNSPSGPGDTLWLRGGIYAGAFKSALTGTATAPIVVRPMPGEHVTIDSTGSADDALYVAGAWTWYWGLEVRNTHPHRHSVEPFAADILRGGGVVAHAPGVKFINLVVHDMLNGFGVWKSSPDAEVYGSLIYNNGYGAADRGHGHGIYAQNETGTQRFADNILFGGFGHGIHAYGSDAAFLDHMEFEGNVVFNSGALSGLYQRNILVGGGRRAVAPLLRRNYTYYAETFRGGENNVGYHAGCRDLIAEQNYFAHQRQYPLVIRENCDGVVRDNTFIGAVDQETRARFAENTYMSESPTGLAIFVRPNRYERGRAHIIVYNWDDLPRIEVSLDSTGLAAGAAFEIRDAQNYFGPPVLTGIHTPRQSVTLPMDHTETARPAGTLSLMPHHTGREFGVFVVVPGLSDARSREPRNNR